MKVALCTCFIEQPDAREGEYAYVAITDALKAHYCRLHENVDFICSKENPHPDRDPHFCKFAMLLYAFLKGYDWAVWMDADAAPVNMDFDIAEYLSSVDQTKMVILNDINGLNSGVFAMPNTEKSDQWLRMLDTQQVNDFFKSKPCWDQAAIADSLKSEHFMDFTQEPDPSIGFNSYENIYRYGDVEMPNTYRKGHWVLHIPGMMNMYRARRFQLELQRVKLPSCPVCGTISEPYFTLQMDAGLERDARERVLSNSELVDNWNVEYCICPHCEHIFAPMFKRFDAGFLARNIYNDGYAGVCPSFSEKSAEDFFVTLAPTICGKQERVLDYGAGKGHFARLLRETNLPVDSYDPFFGKAKKPPTHLKYSLVTCINAMQNIYDWDAAFVDFRRLLVPGGTLLAIAPVWDGNPDAFGKTPDKWGLLVPARGDVCIGSTKSLGIAAARNGLNYKLKDSNSFIHVFERACDDR